MEYLNELIQLIGGAVSSIVMPLLGIFLFYNAKERKAYAEARKAEMDNLTGYAAEWKELYEQRDSRVCELNQKIDQLYVEKNDDRQRIRELQEKVSALTQENQVLRFKECQVRGCKDRMPPSDY